MPFRDDNIGKEEAIASRKPDSKRNTQKDKRNKKRGTGKGKGTSGTSVKYSIVGNIITLSAGQDNPSNELTSDLVGATISVSNPHTIIKSDLYTTANGFTLPTSYSTQISKVVNSKTFEVVEPYYVTDKGGKRFPASLNPGSITITYDTFKTETEDSVYQRSYANLTIGNLRTFSGDVYKAKIYYRPSLATTDFEEIYDTFVVPENVLVDSNSLNKFENIGFFHTESIVDNNWVSSSTTTQTSPFVTLTNEKLIDGLEISGSVSKLEDKVNFRTSQSFDLEQGVDYVVRFNSYYYKSISEKRDSSDSISNESYASMKVFLSGSALTGNSGESDFFLGEVDIPEPSADEGLVENVVGRFKSSGDGSPKAWLKFELNSGKFHIQDVSVEPFSEINFNPSFFKVLVPMPKPQGKRFDKYDFLVEFYDSNNNLAETTAQINGVQFFGPRQVIADGEDAVFTGSMLIGESLEMYGVNPAYLRSVGYNGFDNTISGNKGGFLLYSGSVGTPIGASETYNGVGLEIVDAHSSQDRYLKFGTNPSIFEVVTDTFFLGQSSGAFISGSNGKLQLSSDNFSVSANGDVTASGFISASGGHIGNFTLDAGRISGSNITMDANNSTIFKTDQGPGSDTTAAFPYLKNEYYIDFTPEVESPDNFFIKMGPNFMVDKDGILIASGATFQGSITASAGLIGGFTIGSASLFSGANSTTTPFFFSGSGHTGTNFVNSNLVISSSGFQVNSTGAISASSGQIGGFDIGDTTLSNGTDIVLDANSKKITLDDGSLVIDNNGGTPVIRSATNFADGNGFFLSTATSNNFRVGVSGQARLQFTGTNTEIYNASNDKLVSLGASNEIAGWTIGTTTLRGGNLILDKEGTIQSAGFSSGNIAGSGQGFRLTALDNGFLEVGNARIRGTLSTAVFEKETVNAVGGQLLIGNSTTITGSGGVTGLAASSATMSVENVSGFTGSYNGFNGVGAVSDIDLVDGEILLIKRVDNTGFSTEYVCVQSASFNDPDNTETNSSGLLYVTRSFGLGTGTLGAGPGSNFTGSVGEGAKDYQDGQVIVSTGKYISGTGTNTVGSGYINLNARPTDGATPYIDIVERTGSKVYEMDLKARLGDLSGLSSGLVGSDPGFGLFSQNVFLTGKITATSGEIGGMTIDSDSIFTGTKDTAGFASGNGDVTIGTSGIHSKNFFVNTSDGTAGFSGTVTIGGTNLDANNTLNTNTDLDDVGLSLADISGSISGSYLNEGSSSLASSVKIEPTGISIDNRSGVSLAELTNTLRIGLDASDKSALRIASDGTLTIGTNSTQEVSIASDGSATFTGTVTIGGTNLTTGNTLNTNTTLDNVGLSKAEISGSISGSYLNAASASLSAASQSMQTQLVLTGGGMDLKTPGGVTLASYGTNVTIGKATGTESNVFIDSNSVDIRTGTNVTASFGATTTIGNTEHEHIKISGSGFELKDGTTQYIGVDSEGMSIGNNITLTTSGNATFNGTVKIGSTSLDSTNTLNENTTAGNVGLGNVLNQAQIQTFRQNGVPTATAAGDIWIDTDDNNKVYIATAAGDNQVGSGEWIASTINATAIGLGNVDNTDDQGTTQGGLIDGVTITGGGITIGSGGSIKSSGKDNVNDPTSGFFLGSGGSNTHDFVVGDANNRLMFAGSDSGNFQITASKFGLDAVSGDIGVKVDSSNATIIAQSGSNDTAVKIIGKTGANQGGALQVSQSQIPILQVGGGERQIFSSISNMTMGSVPLQEDEQQLSAGSSGNTAFGRDFLSLEEVVTGNIPLSQVDDIPDQVSAGVGIPTVRMASAVVSSHLSSSKINAGESLFLRNQKVGSTKNTKFKVFLNDTGASGSVDNIPIGFDVRKTYANANFVNSNHIKQTAAFNSIHISNDADHARFVANGQTTGSAIYHFQEVLQENTNDHWADGKFCLMRLDTDTHDLNTSDRRSEFVFLEARNSKTAQTMNTRVFQLQHDGEIVAAGDITGFGTAFMNVSDKRLKKDVNTISGSLDKILKLRPTGFTWIENEKEDVGFIAQEVEEIIPEVVKTKKGFINTDGEEEGIENMKTISYTKLIPYLVDTIQVMDKRIKELEEKVD